MANTNGVEHNVSSFSKPLQLPLSVEDLASINSHLGTLTPQEIIRWGIDHLPGLAQTTAFGLTGLVALDMTSKLGISPSDRPPVIFLDTLYHFVETYELVKEVEKQYDLVVHVFKPYYCETVKDFENKYGEKFWEVDENSYDYAVKVSPLEIFWWKLHLIPFLFFFFFAGRAFSESL